MIKKLVKCKTSIELNMKKVRHWHGWTDLNRCSVKESMGIEQPFASTDEVTNDNNKKKLTDFFQLNIEEEKKFTSSWYN